MMSTDKRQNRPLFFKKEYIQEFVYGNSMQANQCYPLAPHHFKQPPVSGSSLFDRYNRSNLLLRECDPSDVQKLSKNVVLSQNELSSQMMEEISAKAAKRNDHKMYTTGLTYQAPGMEKTGAFSKTGQQFHETKSKQFMESEIMFNYKQLGQEKRQRKKQFLLQIEAKINQVEMETAELCEIQQEQKYGIVDLYAQQKHYEEEISKNVKHGKINEIIGFVSQEPLSPRRELNVYMESREVNEVLEEHYKLNEDIFDQVNRVKNRSLSKEMPNSKGKLYKSPKKTASNFGQTLTKEWGPKQKASKTLVNTMRAPPKVAKANKSNK